MLLEVVVAAFVLTQLGYGLVNCGLLALYLRRPTNVVDERTLGRLLESTAGENEDRSVPRAHTDGGYEMAAAENEQDSGHPCRLPPKYRRRIHVFVPLTDGRWGPLEATLSSLAAQSYPESLISVTVVYEPRETNVPELEGVIDANRPPGLEVETVALERDGTETTREDDQWWLAGTETSPTTAAMLATAFDARSFAEDDLVTVFEAGSWVPIDTFELAISGLEEYDIVQTRRTVRDVDAGLLPLLESMATAAWSALGPTASTGPYHLRGTGYVTEARVLEDLHQRRLETGDDRPLGLAASRRGYTLGVVDRYVREPCPVALEAWLDGKRRRVSGLSRTLFGRGWTGADEARCWSGTLLLGALALISVVGVPAAAIVVFLTASGATAGTAPLALQLLVGFNAVVWAYSSVRAYRAAWDAIPFRSHAHRTAYFVLSNPLSQALYATLWAAPIVLGVVDAVRGGRGTPESSRP